MNFLHHEFDAGPNDVIEVTLNGQANVLLLDGSAYSNYRQRRAYQYRGGLATASPFRIVPPRQGHWHLVIDLGGYSGTVKAGVQVLQGINS